MLFYKKLMHGYFLVSRHIPTVERDPVTKYRENVLRHVVTILSDFVNLRPTGTLKLIVKNRFKSNLVTYC